MLRQAWKRSFSRQTQQHAASNDTKSKRLAIIASVGTVVTLVASYKTRQWRNRHLKELPDWQEMAVSPQHQNRSIDSLTKIMRRTKLMGGVKMGVSKELEDIRKWHLDHGYKGGLVLRELNTPLWHSSQDDEHFEFMDASALARRECYYLYYEIKPNGQISQEIFCRGTTLTVDVWTCLQFFWKYDEELECKIHGGFLKQANHVLKDILPLLAPPSDKRATIQVSGHSLGGAVASILAMKLALLGYNVVKLTTVGAPRICMQESVQHLSKLLPPGTLRIEDDLDIVPFLPPFANHVGDKLWMVHSGGNDKVATKFVPIQQFPWTDSAWINLRFYEVLTSFSQHHRVKSYIHELIASASQNDENNDETHSTRFQESE